MPLSCRGTRRHSRDQRASRGTLAARAWRIRIHCPQSFFNSPGARYDKVRRAGVAVSLGEFVPELAAVSCPVFSPGRQLIGALSVGGFRSRFTKTAIARFQARLLAAAREITDTLDDDGLRPRDNRRKPDGPRAHRPGLDD